MSPEIFHTIWIVSAIAFIAIAVWGFARHSIGTRFWLSIAIVVSAMVAAAQGLVMFALFFWTFPAGLYPGFGSLLGMLTWNDNYWSPGKFVIGWTILITLIGVYTFTQNRKISLAAWVILVCILMITIPGCHPIISSLKNI